MKSIFDERPLWSPSRLKSASRHAEKLSQADKDPSERLVALPLAAIRENELPCLHCEVAREAALGVVRLRRAACQGAQRGAGSDRKAGRPSVGVVEDLRGRLPQSGAVPTTCIAATRQGRRLVPGDQDYNPFNQDYNPFKKIETT